MTITTKFSVNINKYLFIFTDVNNASFLKPSFKWLSIVRSYFEIIPLKFVRHLSCSLMIKPALGHLYSFYSVNYHRYACRWWVSFLCWVIESFSHSIHQKRASSSCLSRNVIKHHRNSLKQCFHINYNIETRLLYLLYNWLLACFELTKSGSFRTTLVIIWTSEPRNIDSYESVHGLEREQFVHF